MTKRRSAQVWWLCAAGACISTAAWAQEAPAPQPVATPAPSEAAPAEAAPERFVRVSGLVQVDAVAFNQSSLDEVDPSSGEPLNEDRFVLRHAMLRADAGRGAFHGHVTIDANSVREPLLRLLEADLSAGTPIARDQPAVLGTLGVFLLPFGFETQEREAARIFLLESNWVRALFPGRRDLGARVEARFRFLRAQVALTNGNPSNTAQFPLRDPNRAKDLLGRIGVDGELARHVNVRAGTSLLLGTGFHRGRSETKDMVVWRDANEDSVVQPTELQVLAGTPAEASRNFDHFALGADLGVEAELPVLGALRVYAELAWAKNLDRGLWPADPSFTGRAARELGFTLGVRQYLTRHAEIGVRYDRYDPDLDANDAQGARLVPIDASFSTLALAVAWCTFADVRVTLEYDHNTNPLGRSTSGEPTTLAADTLTLRGQLEL